MRRGKRGVGAFPLLPAFGAQLCKVVYQALSFLCRYVGNALLLLYLYKTTRADKQFVGDALATGLYLLLQFGDGLFTDLAALLQPFYLC